MNSWIGGSLSSLKGQLTNLITEGTEEVSDPKSELIVAKQRIADLDNQIRSSSLEVKELTVRNNELKIKLQSEEMLLQSVSDSYKEKLKQKEDSLESLREQLSASVNYLDNGAGAQNDSSLMRSDGWRGEIYDFVNEPRNDVTEADTLRARIAELIQEVLRLRSLVDTAQSNRVNFIGDSMDDSVAKLLEIQQQDLELKHSNYILELQLEHSKQLHFLRRRCHQRSSTSDNDDDFEEDDSRQLSEDTQTLVPSKVTTRDTGTNTTHFPMQYDVACQGLIEVPLADIVMSDSASFRMAPAMGHNPCDSMSQVSDVSEVSTKSHLLSEHVRYLSTRIDEYGQQLTSIDDLVLTSDKDNDTEELTNKLQHLKLKLSQRKNVIIDQNSALITAEILEHESSTCPDSWENSSDNSLVQETPFDLKATKDLESRINDLYQILYSSRPANNLTAVETLEKIKYMAINILKKIDNEIDLKDCLLAFYIELGGCSNSDNNVTSLLDGIKSKFKDLNMDKNYIKEKELALENAILNFDQEKSVLEEEIIELARKNCELEEKIDDMSSTITRYESLEKVCDRYEKELLELKGCSKKTDLGMDSEDILEHVKTFNEEKDECIEKLESRIISLQNFCEEKDDFIKAMKERELEIIYEYDCSIRVLSNELDNVRATVEKSYENEIEFKKEMYRINLNIIEKDEMINSLNEELTMLSHQNTDEDIVLMTKNICVEDSSQTDDIKMIEYGDDYVTMHEQTNLLIAENKRLEEVIVAQSNSLSQYEARVNSLDAEVSRLSRSMVGGAESESSEEMTRETLQHLSQMIRDKDWEIEALKSKNDSLCIIIKESSTTSDPDTVCHIDKLLNEKEALSKEIIWYQENREQLVNALNLKHKESLNYHGEIQRLVAFINSEQTKWNELSVENVNMKEEIQILLVEKSNSKLPLNYLVDAAVEFQDNLPSYDECIEVANNEQCKSLRERVSNLEMENRQSFGEVRRLEKQLEQVSFELEAARLQFNELLDSHTRCQTQMTHYQEELAKMCKADVASIQLVDTAKDIWNETNEQSVIDASAEELPIVDISDQFRRQQLQCDDHIHQIEQLKAREIKLLKEKQIFQDHLIRIEESYTQDATIAEDREQSLRRQLRETEDKLSLTEDRAMELERKLMNMADNFVVETSDTRIERDEAVKKLRDTESKFLDTSKSLANLQMVLDKFQQEQALELCFQKEHMEQELRSVCKDRDKWQDQCNKLQRSLDVQNDVVEAAQRLTDQMERKDDQLAEIQATMSRKEEVIDSLKMEIRKLNSVTESKVDKILMRNLVIGYFHTPTSKRQDALRVIGSLLQFSDQDYNQIGIDTVNKSRWFSWLRPAGLDAKDHDPHIQEHSFSELFIRFLERESTPLPQLRLPTNQIAAEARQHSSLSHSDDFPYVNASSQATILDHHKFFTTSPIVTKRNGNPSEEKATDNTALKEAPTLFISNLPEPKSEKAASSHRRPDNTRNALLSLLEQ